MCYCALPLRHPGFQRYSLGSGLFSDLFPRGLRLLVITYTHFNDVVSCGLCSAAFKINLQLYTTYPLPKSLVVAVLYQALLVFHKSSSPWINHDVFNYLLFFTFVVFLKRDCNLFLMNLCARCTFSPPRQSPPPPLPHPPLLWSNSPIIQSPQPTLNRKAFLLLSSSCT